MKCRLPSNDELSGKLVSRRRCGALTVEAAVVLPVMIVLLIGLMVGGLGVFRYQLVAALAREAARHAAVRGSEHQRTTTQTCPTEAEIRKQAVLPLAAGMDPAKLSTTIEWVSPPSGKVVAWDSSNKSPTSLDSSNRPVSNRVRVTVTFDWSPGVLLTGTMQLKSVCEIPMSFQSSEHRHRFRRRRNQRPHLLRHGIHRRTDARLLGARERTAWH